LISISAILNGGVEVMSSNVENEGGVGTESDCESDSAKHVRQAFAALPFGQRVSTLINVQLDMMGEAANIFVSEASRALDEIADVFVGKKESSDQPGGGEQAPQA